MGTLTPPDGLTVHELTARLASHLRARGSLTEPRWERALRDVPRHLFAPAAIWCTSNHASAPRGRFALDDDPAAWWAAVYSDTSIVLQADDGAGDPLSGKGLFSSSVSAPGIVFPFLELLDPQEGDRILEIGTGSGWTAGLLSWATGPNSVTSIEVDPEMAARAAVNLRKAGYSPHLVVGDGIKGWSEHAPFDRVHVTVGVSDIPMAWIEQTRPGGIIVLPWHAGGLVGHQLRLTVVDEATAVGRLHGAASFMMLREQRYNSRWSGHHHEAAHRSTTRINPRTFWDLDRGAQLLCIALVPRVGWYDLSEDGENSLLLYELDDHTAEGSWAACDHKPGAAEAEVTQYGDRRLWDELLSAYRQWISLGRPGYDRFGLTVDPAGTHLWLDHPSARMWTLQT
ncbi:protein-L-isoaspartate(D-aspartate) O-methyltransferase [Nonomuraea sp. FMUSA5-5]|uniref:Protein-L-isoaspartate O-methyltransferase n=1 Tax=Nonomuraea composti TaxID=2720023 RepID=A0ABX1BIU5_9ACTN|nr:protein-L-isoaspartate O-methyltransferase [Nonomuraea sp. FMUSA5-5]NJP96412.1 protein-L-isoaspartate(D-aspartate) O-methyltransferase [Nonomuraea sp. FMUSA5-5]